MVTLRVLLVTLSILAALAGAAGRWAVVHAMGVLLFVNPLILTPACVLLGADTYADHGRWRSTFGLRQADARTAWARRALGMFVLALGTGFLVSLYLAHDTQARFVRSVYGARLWMDDLAPSAGIAWYFFVQMFAHFKPFFLLVVNVHMWSYMAPLTWKYR